MERDLRRGSNSIATIANLPESLLGDQPPPGGRGKASPAMPGSEFTRPINADQTRREYVEQLIEELNDRRTREQALHSLSKARFEMVLLMCLLFKCQKILATIPLYLYPFIGTENKDKPHEYLRLSSLGAIGALLKGHPPNRDEVDPEIIHFLLESQILCFCIRCMEVGTVLSRTVATFIVERILATDEGLNYCCKFGDRFYVVTRFLGKMTDKLVEEPSRRLLKLIIKCFTELSKGPRDSDSLRCCIPKSLAYPNIINLLSGDGDAMRRLQQLLKNVQAHISTTGELVIGNLIES
ncbi:uncharacterized protein LOC126797303 [Argentina anserina]|uniref:uncharacterized protein LOC126797303 n=1 Tax=Argentina anserina TaxID=57926 RepID=UPI0021763D15|nr:uncharacterized protein LOC126797303 [Potentilla anserina]